VGFAFALLIVLTYAGLTIVAYRLKPVARAKAVELLEKEFDRVQLDELEVQPFPGFLLTPTLLARGEGLAVSLKGREDAPPFVSMNEFEVELSVLGLLREPIRIEKLTLDRLEIQIPPGRDKVDKEEKTGSAKKPMPPVFVIDQMVADGTVLRILPKDPEKTPLQFDLHELKLQSVGLGEPMSFEAILDNPKPPGRIDTEGKFGPLRLDEPGMSPVSGSYVFKDADLSVFGGIAGTLYSEGSFRGRLGELEVDGFADVPDFMLEGVGQPVNLKTEYEALVDGTNGDTRLRPVAAQIESSRFETKGGVVREPGVKGKVVRLEAQSSEARIEDFLRLAVKSNEPLLTGDIRFESEIVIPPGDLAVVRKLELDGRFEIEQATFPESAQAKIEELSKKAQSGAQKPPLGSESRVVSNMSGAFVLRDGLMTLTDLIFSVPGAQVTLDGTYGLVDNQLDFRGDVQLDAKLSEMTTGVKSALLKILDPLFKSEDATTVIPIKITGTTGDPKVGLEMGRVLKGKKGTTP
jgi:hypothetical protein